MMFLFKPNSQANQAARSGMLSFSLLCILFGLLIFAAPEFLAYLVGAFFLFIGIATLMTWWRLR